MAATKASAKTTTNHEKIRRWADPRGGEPATVQRTGGKGDPGILRIDFPGGRGAQSLRHISWDQFFRKSDEKHLTFLYQEKTAKGQPSRFNKFVCKENVKGKARK